MEHLTNNIKLKLPDNKPVSSGGGGWDLHRDHVENWAWVSGVFNNPELDAICNIGKSLNISKATTLGGESNLRKSHVAFIQINEHTSWIFEKLSLVINDINHQYFKFDLTSMNQGLQYTEYNSPGQHYGWHIDKGLGLRKLSLSLQLSSPTEYEGGDLELWLGGDEPVKIEKQKGMITFFPSYVLHRVTPVTSGIRKSLVCWISGPPFK